ncbi:MAG: protein translocase subunit SecD [Alphaproteobacteria bacterium]|nr:protein translocase subunit SecD [Alphaproteobacteria bacterium]
MHPTRFRLIGILIVCLIGVMLALPNVLPKDMAGRLPEWLTPVNLGLDLQGGSHLLLEVEVKEVLREQLTSLVEGARAGLRKERVGYANLGVEGDAMTVKILEPERLSDARRLLQEMDREVVIEAKEGGVLVARYGEQAMRARTTAAVAQSIEIVRRRIDELGTREPTIVRQGESRILVQIPGVDDPERVKSLIGKTAKLTFHLVDATAAPGRVPPGSEVLPATERGGNLPESYVVRKKVELGGDALVDAGVSFQQNVPVVSFRFDTAGGRKFGDLTTENVGRQLAIVLDRKVISAPVIRTPIIGGSGIIEGNFTVQTAQDLALLLRAGALPAPLTVLEERTVGPDLGADSIRAGAVASALGLVFVILFMLVAYGVFGVIANLALILNLILLVACLSAIGATLTLPGIAGIVLTMGMAVDANVLIFERMREEYRNGRTVLNAMQAGFDRAIITILDSNLTTLVAAALLFAFGTGPVRGFAVTLTIGLTTSMFTAVMVTRAMLAIWVRRVRPKALPI